MTLHRAILRAAALLAPAAQRDEWFAEWSAELWYVERGRTRFCLGAFRDALWLRRNSAAPNAFRSFGLESPLRCVLLLAILAGVSVFFALRLPLPRAVLLRSPYPHARSLAMLSTAGSATVSIDRYQALASSMPQHFTGAAFYRPLKRTARIAAASANLFQLLDIPISVTAPASLVLSDVAWRRDYGADAHIVGRAVEVAGQTAVIAGVIPASSWGLPGRFDAWLLLDQAHLAALPPETEGFVLAHLRASSTGWHRAGSLVCSPLDQGPFFIASLFMISIAILLLSTTMPLAQGEYPAHRRVRRWLFFAAKIAMLAPIVCCGSLDVASVAGMGFQPHGILLASFFALRWALIDQRIRCPVCLRVLTGPTRIGGPSQIFLAWYGTELVCARGHGLLYVPEIPTSCYSTHRWQQLDASWSCLFHEHRS